MPGVDVTENTIRIRQHDPSGYIRFRIKDLGGGVKAVIGFKKGGGSEVQSYIFDKSKFTPAQAAAWVKEHGGKILSKEFSIFRDWDTAYVNDLPDSAFAIVEPAYKKGDTDNKAARHLPYKGKDGKIDLPHLRNALARVGMIKPITDSISASDLRNQARNVLIAAAKRAGVGDYSVSCMSKECPYGSIFNLGNKKIKPESMNAETLLFNHKLAHSVFEIIKKGSSVDGWDGLDDVFNYHLDLANEMQKRGIYHDMWDEELDRVVLDEETAKQAKDVNVNIFEFYSQRQLTRVGLDGNIEQGDFPLFVGRRYNGFACQIHKDGNNVKMFCDAGIDITDRLPRLEKRIRKLSCASTVLNGVVEKWVDNECLSREDIAEYVYSEQPSEDNWGLFTATDILYLDGNDLHRKPLIERRKSLVTLRRKTDIFGKPEVGQKFNIMPGFIVYNQEQFDSAVGKICTLDLFTGITAKKMAAINEVLYLDLFGEKILDYSEAVIYDYQLSEDEIKGQKIWNIQLVNDKDEKWFVFDSNIIDEEVTNALAKKVLSTKKRIKIDRGKCTVFKDTKTEKIMKFEGDLLDLSLIFVATKDDWNKFVVKKETKKFCVQKLSLNLGDIEVLDKLSVNGKYLLEFKGTAIREGRWNKIYFPRERIKESTGMLKGKRLNLEHQDNNQKKDYNVGVVLEDMWNEKKLGLDVRCGITSPLAAQLIRDKKVTGLSIEVYYELNKDKEGHFVEKIIKYAGLGIVLVPACVSCHITEIK